MSYILTLIEITTELLFPLFLGIMINEGIMENNIENVIMWGSIMLAVSSFTFTAGIINSYFSSHVSATFAYDIREKLFQKIQTFTYENLGLYPASTLVTRFTNDVRQ